MLRSRLSSTTALVLSLSLAAPMPVLAEGGGNVQFCDERMQFPCAIPGVGTVVQNRQELEALGQGGNTESQTGVTVQPAPAPETAQPEAEQPAADTAPPPAAASTQTPEQPPAKAAPDNTAEKAETAPQPAPQPAPVRSESTESQAPAAAPQATAPAATEQSAAPEAAPAPAKEKKEKTERKEKKPKKDKTAEQAPPRSESTENQVPPVISAEDQAAAAARAEEATAAAAAEGTGQVVDTTATTVTEDEARSSGEEFSTTASGQPAPAAKSRDDKGEKVLKLLGTAAVAGVSAYAIGKMLDGGGKVVSNTGDRVVVEQDGQYTILKDDDTLLRRPGSEVETQTFSDGSTRTTVTARDGSQTITIRAANGRVLSRTRVLQDGRRVVLFDDTEDFQKVDVSKLRPARSQDYDYSTSDVDELRAALAAKNGQLPDRRFSLNQIRRIDAVRKLVPVIALDAINFQTGSAVIRPQEAEALSNLGNAMLDAIDRDPDQVFLIEGHTDTVGAASYNLALSDRRAESVALALTEYFDVPPSNMIVQGYGEADLKIRQEGDIRANRRAAVRNITPLLRGAGG